MFITFPTCIIVIKQRWRNMGPERVFLKDHDLRHVGGSPVQGFPFGFVRILTEKF